MITVLSNALPFWIGSFIVLAVAAGAILFAGFRLGKRKPENGILSVYLACILFLAFFTRFLGFQYPFNTFWDENYHVASAQKYIDHVMFMEPHPPLGKLLIAFGEWALKPNAAIDTSGFLTTDYIRDFPAGYSFLGVRFIPTLLSTLSVLVFFLILFGISKNPHYSFLFSFFYLFENSMILHTRSAMLEGPQLFFILTSIWYFIVLFIKDGMTKKTEYLFLGFLVGLAVAVKVNSLIITVIFLLLAWKDHWPEIREIDWKKFLEDRKEALRRTGKLLLTLALKALSAAGGIAAVFCLSYYIHFALGDKVLQNRTYRATPQYIEVLKNYQTANLLNFPLQLRDSLEFTHNYEKGVPLWDPTKKDENGSPAFTWPLGYKSINYRWEKNLGRVSYFYFQGNPLVWFAGLLAVITMFGLILAKLAFGFQVRDTQKLSLAGLFTFLYFVYMAVMSQIDRVLYLYHYLLPLVFALIVLYLLFTILFDSLIQANDKLLYYTAALIALEVFAAFLFFSPFTYGIPLTASDFVKRAWMRIWDLKYLFF